MEHTLNPRDIGQSPDTLGVIQSGRSIQTTSRVIPRKHTTLSTESLGDRNTLPLSSRNTSDEFVSDQRVARVLNVQHLEQGGKEFLSEFFVRDTAGELSGGLASQGGLDGLPNGQGRQVDVICTRTQERGLATRLGSISCMIVTHLPDCTRPLQNTSSSSPGPTTLGIRHHP